MDLEVAELLLRDDVVAAGRLVGQEAVFDQPVDWAARVLHVEQRRRILVLHRLVVEHDRCAVRVIAVGVARGPHGRTHADPVDRAFGWRRRRLAGRPRAAAHRHRVVADELAAFDPGVKLRPRRFLRRAAGLEDQLAVLDLHRRQRNRVRRPVEEQRIELAALFLELEPEHLIRVRSGASDVPLAQKRIRRLLSARSAGREKKRTNQ